MNKFKNIVSKIAAAATVAGFSTLNALAQVQAPSINADTSVTTVTLAKSRIVTYANTFIGIVGLIAVVMLIYGGYLYVTAGTNEDNTKKAKSIVTYGFIGLAVAVLSYAIVAVSVSFISTGA